MTDANFPTHNDESLLMSPLSIGPTVRRLRLANGLDQARLSEAAGLSSGALSMLENGRLHLSSEQLEPLADALDCSTEYLTAAYADPVTTKPWLRAYADAPKRDVDRLIADSEIALSAFHALGLRRVPDNLPAFDGDLENDDEIESFAEEVRLAANIEPGSVVTNSIRAAERLGVVVLPMDSELGRHMGLSMRINGVPVIRAAREGAVPGDRQRFTLAHELGHLTLHHATPSPTSPPEATRIEKQAHRFAGAFLAPADPLIADLETVGGKVTITTLIKLKATWGYSIKAFVMRFQQLEVIDSDQARSLYKQISARKMNKVEPVVVDNEGARWPAAAFKSASVDDPSARLGLGPTYFRNWVDWTAATTADVVDLEARRRA